MRAGRNYSNDRSVARAIRTGRARPFRAELARPDPVTPALVVPVVAAFLPKGGFQSATADPVVRMLSWANVLPA